MANSAATADLSFSYKHVFYYMVFGDLHETYIVEHINYCYWSQTHRLIKVQMKWLMKEEDTCSEEKTANS